MEYTNKLGVDIVNKEPCHICNNALVDDELNHDNDFASHTIGYNCNGFRAMISSGWNKPVRIEFEQWCPNIKQWVPVGVYYPKYCPECGRELSEYKILDRGNNYGR